MDTCRVTPCTLCSVLLLLLLAGTLPIKSLAGQTTGVVVVDSFPDNDPGGACTLRQTIALIDGAPGTGNCSLTGSDSPPVIHFDLE